MRPAQPPAAATAAPMTTATAPPVPTGFLEPESPRSRSTRQAIAAPTAATAIATAPFPA